MKFYFSKTGRMRFISHLDLMRLFARAARRAGLPLLISKGFNPHPKVRLKRALKLGQSSFREEGEIILRQTIDGEEFCRRLNERLTKGIIVSV